MRPAYDEAPRGVDKYAGILAQKLLGYHLFYHLSPHGLGKRSLSYVLAVLRGYDYRIYAYGNVVFIYHAHLGLAVRLYKGGAALPVCGKPSCKRMRKVYGQGHVFLCFICGITEHHALIARARGHIGLYALLYLKRPVNTHCYIARLLAKRYEHGAAVRAKAKAVVRIAHVVYHLSCQGRYIHLRL